MKPNLLTILSFSIALSGCATNVKNISWDKVSLTEIRNICKERKDIVGCAMYAKDGSWCRVYTPKHEDMDKVFPGQKMTNEVKEWLILGHEMKHCFEGSFHKD